MNTVLQSDYTTLALKSNHMYSSPLYKICCFSVAKKNETIHFPPACIKGHTSSCLFAACQTWRPSKPFGSLNSSLEKLFKNSSFMWKDYSGISETYRLCKCQLNCKASGGGGGGILSGAPIQHQWAVGGQEIGIVQQHRNVCLVKILVCNAAS